MATKKTAPKPQKSICYFRGCKESANRGEFFCSKHKAWYCKAFCNHK